MATDVLTKLTTIAWVLLAAGLPPAESVELHCTCEQSPTCSTTAVSRKCTCDNGYYMATAAVCHNLTACSPFGAGIGCRDIDECDRDTHDCAYSEKCVNTPGSYTCLRETKCRRYRWRTRHCRKCAWYKAKGQRGCGGLLKRRRRRRRRNRRN